MRQRCLYREKYYCNSAEPDRQTASSRKLVQASSSANKSSKERKKERNGSRSNQSGDLSSTKSDPAHAGEDSIESGAKRWSADQMFAKMKN